MSHRLEGWKVIAAHLHRTVRWCRRYQSKHEGDAELRIPIYRFSTAKQARACADTDQLTAWMRRVKHNLAETTSGADESR